MCVIDLTLFIQHIPSHRTTPQDPTQPSEKSRVIKLISQSNNFKNFQFRKLLQSRTNLFGNAMIYGDGDVVGDHFLCCLKTICIKVSQIMVFIATIRNHKNSFKWKCKFSAINLCGFWKRKDSLFKRTLLVDGWEYTIYDFITFCLFMTRQRTSGLAVYITLTLCVEGNGRYVSMTGRTSFYMTVSVSVLANNQSNHVSIYIYNSSQTYCSQFLLSILSRYLTSSRLRDNTHHHFHSLRNG